MSLPASNYFELHELATGVFAAEARPSSGAASNAGIVDLGDRTLVFDTFLVPQAAADLRDAAVTLTDRAPTLVINSHFHGDHVRGNQVFDDTAVVISTTRTRELIATVGVPQVAQMKTAGGQMLADLEALVAAEQDPARREQLDKQLRRSRVVAESLPDLQLRLPELTFERQLVFHGTRRTALLISPGGGHTDSDAVLYLPDDEVVFVADLLFNGLHPWAGDGYPAACALILDELLSWEFGPVVGGHGPLATAVELRAMRSYMQMLAETLSGLLAADAAPDEVAAVPVPAEWRHLENPERFSGSLQALVKRERHE